MSEQESITLPVDAMLAVLKEIFRPASPTVERRLFKGRDRELSTLIGAIHEVGMHAVVYGERGVGKTSIALMGREAFTAVHPTALALRIPCAADDTFESVWSRLPAHLQKALDLKSEVERSALQPLLDRVEDILMDTPTPDLVARCLHLLGSKVPVLVIIDEFDRIGPVATTLKFADLIKSVSDDPAASTIVMVGVADDVDGLVQGHRSIDRAMRQVQVPRMTRSELAEFVIEGMSEFRQRTGSEIELDSEVVDAVANLSQGFPYYTHLLAGAIVERALRTDLQRVSKDMVFEALVEAADTAAQSIRTAYAEAVLSNQNAQYEETLLACALARTDVAGFFRASDVIDPLAEICGRRKAQSNFNHHLKRFSEQSPIVLEARGDTRYRYRFADPLMKPFVIMAGIASGRLPMPGSNS